LGLRLPAVGGVVADTKELPTQGAFGILTMILGGDFVPSVGALLRSLPFLAGEDIAQTKT